MISDILQMWTAIILDPQVTLVMKAAALLYTMVAPFSLGYVPVDLTAVYVAGIACGAACLAVDLTLGLLIIIAVVTSMVTINRAKDRPRRPVADDDPMLYACDVVATLPVPVSAVDQPEEAQKPNPEPPSPPQPPPPPPPPQPQPQPVADEDDEGMCFREEDDAGGGGQRFLLQPDGFFVTEESLASAQTNQVGPDSVYCPLGKDSYGVQGVTSGVSVMPMVW